ncbi:D-methionine transport system substrate-binding protein [Xanthobacter flavus]|uniref:Lipoprotein n=1 Tax=Xanthobacter flavus TaxID=281 RepID=A0A9W6CPC8_XANFL|nr:MetQ/NlpA family ABC transporter substrate-binding protein [Xanthobacter flavus]MDR6334134.1 D-methionine transport system substrate-binding protein [Xanthobacter flavus]GLI22852.1 methionine ABC transporter substrate-binding protein [Xanthobacter flavus]
MTSRFRSPLAALILSGLALIVAGTGANAQAPAADKPLKIGVSAGPYGDILREAAKLSAEQGVKAEIIEFTDWNQPNAALQAGDIDLNNFQNRPYLANQVKTRGYTIVALDESILVPAGLYSKKYTSFADIPAGSKIAIPNDPTNGGRALLLFQKAGLIKLKPGSGLYASVLDVVDNPKNLKIVEIDAAQLPRSLDDVAAAFVSSNYAYLAGLQLKSALLAETTLEEAKPYFTLVFAAREDRKDDPRIAKFIAVYRSQPVKDFTLAKFNGSLIPTW